MPTDRYLLNKKGYSLKIQKISSIEPTLGFTEFDILQKYRQSFERSELGHLYSIIPFSELARSMNLQEFPLGS